MHLSLTFLFGLILYSAVCTVWPPWPCVCMFESVIDFCTHRADQADLCVRCLLVEVFFQAFISLTACL